MLGVILMAGSGVVTDIVAYFVIYCVAGTFIPAWGAEKGKGVMWVAKWSSAVSFFSMLFIVLFVGFGDVLRGVVVSMFLGVFIPILAVAYYFFQINMIDLKREREEKSKQGD